MDNKKREMCSLERELKLLRPFVQEQPPSVRCYSEEEILAAEQRLNYKLPSPVRFMYLYMADMLISSNYLRPLELIHWDHDHLGFFVSGDWDDIIGICRNADANTLYFWEEKDPEGDSYEMEDEFKECCESGDECGKQRVVQKYLDYWDSIENDASSSQREFKSEKYDDLLDEYVLFISLNTLYEDYDSLVQTANYGRDPENRSLFLICDYIIDCDSTIIQNLVIKIQELFRPLSEYAELIMGETPPLYTAYIHQKEQILLIKLPGDITINLLTPRKLAPDVLAEIEQSIGLTFHPMRP